MKRIVKATYFKKDDANGFPYVLLEFDNGTNQRFSSIGVKMRLLEYGLIPVQEGGETHTFDYEGSLVTVGGCILQPEAATALLPFADETAEEKLVNGQVLYSSK